MKVHVHFFFAYGPIKQRLGTLSPPAAIQVDYRVGNPHFLGMLEGRYLIIEIASLILIMDINTWLTHCIRVALPYWLSMHPAVESSKLTHMVAMNIPLRFCNHM